MDINLANLIDYIYSSDKQIIYVSIGCANIRYDDMMPPESDRQQYPAFLEKLINETKQSALIILIDPHIESSPSIFQSFTDAFLYGEYNNVFKCNKGYIDVVIIRQHIYLTNTQKEFFHMLNQHVMESPKMLMVHSFAGHNELSIWMNEYVNNTPYDLKSTFLSKIQYDLTHGLDHSCLIDLTDINNIPYFEYENKAIAKIVNYFHYEINELIDKMYLVPPHQLTRIFARKKSHFRCYTLPIYRQIKMLLWAAENNEPIFIDKTILNIEAFDKAKFNFFNEFTKFTIKPNNTSNIFNLHSLLNNALTQQTTELTSFIKDTNNINTLIKLIKEIKDINIKNIYIWMSQYYALRI